MSDDARDLELGRAVRRVFELLGAAQDDAGELVPLEQASQIAATSPRVLRDAIRGGELVAYGRRRDRSVRREDLETWIESRRLRPVDGVDDEDLERRVVRLERVRRRA